MDLTKGKNPIRIELIGKDEFKLTLKLDSWELSKIVSESALIDLQEQIN